MIRLVWLCFLLCASFTSWTKTNLASPLDRNFQGAIAQLNRLNNSLFKGTQRADLKLVINGPGQSSSYSTLVIKTDRGSKSLYQFDNPTFRELFNALKLAIEYTHSVKPKVVSTVPANAFDKLTVDPKKLLDETLALDAETLKDNRALYKVCENLIVLGFFSQDEVTYDHTLPATAWYCYALYEVYSQKRDEALLVMLSSMLGYDDYAMKTARYLAPHPLYDYFFSAPKITANSEVLFPLLTELAKTEPPEIKFVEIEQPNEENEENGEPNEKMYEFVEGKYQLIDNVPPRRESDNEYRQLTPDFPSLPSLLTLKLAVEDTSPETWLGIALSASYASSPSVLFNGIHAVPANELRTKLLMLSPLILANDFLGENKMRDYWYDKSLRTSILDIDSLSQKLADRVNYPPSSLLTAFSTQIDNAPAPSGKFLLPENLVKDYWSARLLNAYYVLVDYLKSENYNEEVIDSLAKVVIDNRRSEVGNILSIWLQASTSIKNKKFALKQLNKLIERDTVPIEMKADTLSSLRDVFTMQSLLPAVNSVAKQFDTSPTSQLRKWRLLAQFGLLNEEDKIKFNKTGRVTLEWVDTVLAIQDVSLIKSILSTDNGQYVLPNLEARLRQGLFNLGEGDDEQLNKLAKLYANYPEHFGVMNAYLHVLVSKYGKEQAHTAQAILDDWIYSGKDLSRPQYLSLIAMLAETKLNLGELDDAKRVINPTLKYLSAENFHVALKIAVASDEVEVGQKLLAHFSKHFPSETDIAQQFEFELALLAGNTDLSAKILAKQADDAQVEVLMRAYARLRNNDQVPKNTQESFLRKLKKNQFPALKINLMKSGKLTA